MWIDQRGSEVLRRNECLRLLALGAGRVGRIGLLDGANVVIEPVNYRIFDGDILVQVGPGSILETARAHGIASFEVDDISIERREAWSVLVHGLAREVDPAVGLESARPAGGAPMVREPGTSFVRIRTGIVSGRRFPISDRAAPAVELRHSPAGCTSVGSLPFRPPTRLGPGATVREVAAAMEDDGVSAVLVSDHPHVLVTERDLAGALAAGLDPSAPAVEVGTAALVWVTTTTRVDEAAAMMANHGVRHLLVVDAATGQSVGVISMLDTIRQLVGSAAGATSVVH